MIPCWSSFSFLFSFFLLFLPMIVLPQQQQHEKEKERERPILVMGQLHGEGVANWRFSWITASTLAVYFNASVVLPCVSGSGRLISCCSKFSVGPITEFFFEKPIQEIMDIIPFSFLFTCNHNQPQWRQDKISPLSFKIGEFDSPTPLIDALTLSKNVFLERFDKRICLPSEFWPTIERIERKVTLPNPRSLICAEEFLKKQFPSQAYSTFVSVNWRVETIPPIRMKECALLLVNQTNDFKAIIANQFGFEKEKIGVIFTSDMLLSGGRRWNDGILTSERDDNYKLASKILTNSGFKQKKNVCEGSYAALIDLILVEKSIGLMTALRHSTRDAKKCSPGRSYNEWMLTTAKHRGRFTCTNWALDPRQDCQKNNVSRKVIFGTNCANHSKRNDLQGLQRKGRRKRRKGNADYPMADLWFSVWILGGVYFGFLFVLFCSLRIIHK